MKITEVHNAINMSLLSKCGTYNSKRFVCFWLERKKCFANDV